jgi:hypothetical protein
MRRAALLAAVLAAMGWIAAPGIAAAAIANPSFEADGENFFFTLTRFPIGWGGAPGGGGHKGQVATGLGETDGSHAADLFIAASGAAPGADAFPARLTQSVDLTGVEVLAFDARLLAEIGWNPLVIADFRIDGVVMWSRTANGVFLDQTIDVSALSGVHEIEFRLTANASGPSTAGHNFFIDNLREVQPPPRLTSTRVDPHVIRSGVDTFTMTVTVSDPSVSEIHIDLGSAVTQGGLPAGVVVFRDDGTLGDAIDGDGVFTAQGIGVASVPALLGIHVLGPRDVDYLFPSAPTIERVEDLALGLRTMNPSVPIPAVTDHAADVRASSHAVSMSAPILGAFPEHEVDVQALAQRQYQFLPDDVDFLMFSHDYGSNIASGTFGLVRNDVVGTGQPIVDSSASFGSAGVLRGRVNVYFGNAADFGLWNHEILHYWAAHLDPSLGLGTGHWGGITGASSGFGVNYAYDRFELVSGNTWSGLDYPDAPLGAYNDLELYLMGLLPAASVASPIETLINPVFQGLGADVCDPVCAKNHLFSADGVASVSMGDILSEEGVRSPAYPVSPQSFKGRLVVIFDRVLTDTELAYYDTAMREYEQATSAHGLTFAAATGGRATIALPEPGGVLGLASGVIGLLLLSRLRRETAGPDEAGRVGWPEGRDPRARPGVREVLR